jgi:hypothetical protein
MHKLKLNDDDVRELLASLPSAIRLIEIRNQLEDMLAEIELAETIEACAL